MELLRMAQELINIADDLKYRLKTINFDEGDLYDFDQTWGSTALGFGGCGGSAMTTARTYVFIPEEPTRDEYSGKAFVYFGGRFAYCTPINERFKEDIRRHNMASVAERGRYLK